MNKTVLISGASSGIGLSLANKMQEDGYTVIGLSRKKPSNISFKYYECDLTNMELIKTVSRKIILDYNTIDILINNAGNAHGLDPIQNGDLDDWDAMIDININSENNIEKLTKLII